MSDTTTMGGVSWVVDADTTGATDSINAMGKQVDKAEVKLLKLDKVTKTYSDTLRKSGNQVSKTGLVIDRYGKVNEHATNRLKKLTEQQIKLTETAAGVKRGIDKAKKGLAGMSRGAGQAGIQVQQFIGQVQGGQSAMLALSQQAADIGIVLGLPMAGAIAGISASLIGMLVPSLMKTTSSLEAVEKATENVKAALTLSVDGVAEYTSEMKKLKMISEALVQVKLANLVAEQAEALKIAQKGIKTSVDDLRGSFDTYRDVVKKIYKEYTPKTVESMRELQKALRDVGRDASPENLQALEAAMIKATSAGINQTKAGRALANQLVSLVAEYKNGTKTIEEIKKALANSNEIIEDSTSKTKDNVKAISSMIEALQLQAKTIDMTDRQIAKYAATRKGATKADLDSIDAAFDVIEASKEKIKTQKELDRVMEESFKNEQKRQLQTQKDLDKIMNASFDDDVKDAGKDKSDRKSGVNFAESVSASGMSPIERLQEEQEKLLELKSKYVDDSATYDEALTANAKKQADLRASYQVANANMILASSESMFGSLASLLKNSGKEQSSAYKAMFALSKGFAVAQAGLNLALAISNASAVAPWYASLAAIAQVTSAGAGMISAISGATYSGRENGGPVNAGQTYEVGEKNKPELLMIPGNNGKVISNAEMKSMSGGGDNGGMGVTINNYAAADGYSAQVSRDPLTHEQVVDIVKNQMGGSNSEGRRAMQGNSNIHGVLNGGRRS